MQLLYVASALVKIIIICTETTDICMDVRVAHPRLLEPYACSYTYTRLQVCICINVHS